MRAEALEVIGYKGHKIEIYQDTDPMNPREWDNLGIMACWHRRYDLGDKALYSGPEEFREALRSDPVLKGAVVLPLYLYDHSGITMSTGPFSCPWDSGQVGYIYVTREKLIKEYGKAGKRERARAEKVLRGEVETYDEYLTGNCYSYTTDLGGGCSGYYGSEGRAGMIAEAKHEIDCAVAEAIAKHVKYVKSAIRSGLLLDYRKPLEV